MTSFKTTLENYFLGISYYKWGLQIGKLDRWNQQQVILTSSINILVIYLLVLLAIYLQIDIYPRFIYKLILFLNWI